MPRGKSEGANVREQPRLWDSQRERERERERERGERERERERELSSEKP